jgi:hypothetical protein
MTNAFSVALKRAGLRRRAFRQMRKRDTIGWCVQLRIVCSMLPRTA